jgi:outer membrane assembly lipoprotein YfiO
MQGTKSMKRIMRIVLLIISSIPIAVVHSHTASNNKQSLLNAKRITKRAETTKSTDTISSRQIAAHEMPEKTATIVSCQPSKGQFKTRRERNYAHRDQKPKKEPKKDRILIGKNQDIVEELTPESQTPSFWQRIKKSVQPKKATLSKKPYDELKELQLFYLEKEDYYLALKYTEKMIAKCDNAEELCLLTFTVADLLFKQKDYQRAGTMFSEFIRLYPGSPYVEYASYHAILCLFEQTHSAVRDQSLTRETIAAAQAFLKRSDVFRQYVDEVQNILNACRHRLFDHELGIFNFYLYRGSTKSAKKRLEGLRRDFGALLPDTEPIILLQECRLAYALKNPEEAEHKAIELATRFPDYITKDTMKKAPDVKMLLAHALPNNKQQTLATNFRDRF